MAAQNYWFKARGKHSVGWAPATWQAWVVLVLYLIFLIQSFFQIDSQSHSVSDTLINFLPRVLLFSALLIIITYLKGEPTTWHHESEGSQPKLTIEDKHHEHTSENHQKDD